MPDSELSDNGNAQAVQLSKRLVEYNISDIICSDYLRTKQTADYTASQLDIKPSYTELLRERNFGKLRGRSYAELSFDPFALDYNPLDGENWSDFDERIALAWELINTVSQKAIGDVLVVTHGLVCHSIIANHTVLDNVFELPTRWGNTSLTEIEQMPPWPVRKLNCIAHLSSGKGLSAPA